MIECYHNPCDTFENAATDDNLGFIKRTTDAVIGTVLELSGHPGRLKNTITILFLLLAARCDYDLSTVVDFLRKVNLVTA